LDWIDPGRLLTGYAAPAQLSCASIGGLDRYGKARVACPWQCSPGQERCLLAAASGGSRILVR
jgi:hypothetical protein